MDKKNGNPFGGSRKDAKPVWISLDVLNTGTTGASGAAGASAATGAATGSKGDTGTDSSAVTAASDSSGTSGSACKIPLEVIPSQYGTLLIAYFANAPPRA